MKKLHSELGMGLELAGADCSDLQVLYDQAEDALREVSEEAGRADFERLLLRAYPLVNRVREAPSSAAANCLRRFLCEVVHQKRSKQKANSYLEFAEAALNEKAIRVLLLDPGPRGLVVQGLVASVPIGVIISMMFRYWLAAPLTDFGVDGQLLGLAAAAGAIGSWVSLASRLDQFDILVGLATERPFVAGLTRPLVGAALAAFLVLAYQGKMLLTFADTLTAPARISLFLASAFALGFSERLQRGAVDSVQQQLLPGGEKGTAEAGPESD